MSKRSLIIPVVLFLLVFASIPALAVGVQPLVVDLNLRPGDRETFELILSPTDTQQIVNLTLYQPVQLITGGLTYQEGDADIYPAIDWIEPDSTQVVVPPREETKVTGHVEVPFDAAGHHTVVVMVEPQPDEAAAGITFRVRYAVRINLLIERPGLRPRAEIASFELLKDEEGSPTIEMLFRNPTPLQYDAAAEVTIHDESRRLIQRVPLLTAAAQQSGRESTRIYPGAEVLYAGVVTEPLFPGNYDMRLFVRYADGMQVIQNESIAIASGEFVQSERGNRLRIQPEKVDIAIRAGGVASQVVQIENRMRETYDLQYSARDVLPEYSRSIFGAMDIQLRAQDVQLGDRRTARAVITARSDRNIAPGGYYGYLDVNLLQNNEPVESYTIPIHAVVEGQIEYVADILSIHTEELDDEQLYTVDIRNMSAAHISPHGTLYIKNAESGVIQETIQLSLQEGLDAILPELSGLMVGTAPALKPGEYTAEISVTHGNKAIGTEEFSLTIPAPALEDDQ